MLCGLRYYRGAGGILLVYDVTDKESFDNIRVWLGEVRRFASSEVAVVLVGNNCDQESRRVVPIEDGREFAGKASS